MSDNAIQEVRREKHGEAGCVAMVGRADMRNAVVGNHLGRRTSARDVNNRRHLEEVVVVEAGLCGMIFVFVRVGGQVAGAQNALSQ